MLHFRSHQKLEKTGKGFPTRASGGSVVLPTLDFGILASRNVREYISVGLSH